MNNQVEYEKRISIINDIREEIKNYVEAIILGGSVAFKQVKESSDIDMAIVVNKSEIDNLMMAKYFENNFDIHTLQLIKLGEINCFWVTRIVNGVEVNTFIYDKKGFEDYCLGKGDRVVYRTKSVGKGHYGYGFEGKKLFFDTNSFPNNNGFIYSHPAKIDGKYYCTVPRADLIYLEAPVFQKNSFFDDLKDKTWKMAVNCLVEEYGLNVDLEKFNILNSIWNFHERKHGRNMLSDEIVNKIKERTRVELEKLKYGN